MRLSFSAGLALLLTLSINAVATAEVPDFPRVSFNDPSPHDSVGIAWNTDGAAPSVVEYGLTEQLGSEESGSSLQAPDPIGFVHEVVLEGLTPDTRYFYRVGDGTDFSDVHSFRTAPAPDEVCGSFNFVALGDDRSQRDNVGPSEIWADIALEAAQHGPAFIMNSGDLVKNGEIPEEWRNWLESVAPVSPHIPHMPALGNHDDDRVDGDNAIYNRIFLLPRNDVEGIGTEDFYAFRYGNALIISLSTVTFEDDGFATQAAWLDRILEESDAMWTVVQFHHPIYTSMGALLHEPNERNQNPVLLPVFDKHHVDVVVNGHNHYYERMGPLRAGRSPDEGEEVDSYEDGTLYVISGGAGAAYSIAILEDAIDGYCRRFGTEGSQRCSLKNHYVVFHIEHNRLRMETWSTTAQNIGGSDPEHRELIDSLEIVKPVPGFDPSRCAAPPTPSPSPSPASSPSPAPQTPDPSPAQSPQASADPTPAQSPAASSTPTDAPATPDPPATQPPGGTPPGGADSGGCDCRSANPALPAWLLFLLVLALRPRRRR